VFQISEKNKRDNRYAKDMLKRPEKREGTGHAAGQKRISQPIMLLLVPMFKREEVRGGKKGTKDKASLKNEEARWRPGRWSGANARLFI